MTREQTIKSALKYLVHKQQEQGSWGYADNDNTNKVSWNEVLEWIGKQPCGDCISRQAVLDLAESGKLVSNGNYKSVCDAINGLPSVEPKQKKGHWIMQNDRSKKLLGWSFCSECNAWIGEPTNYCSNCGADMREVDNE